MLAISEDLIRVSSVKNKMARKKEYWQFVYMVADPNVKKPSCGYTTKECIGLYCEKCDLEMKYLSGDNKTISRHMNRFHMAEMIEYQKEQPEAKQKRTMKDFINRGSTKRLKLCTGKEETELQSLCARWIKNTD